MDEWDEIASLELVDDLWEKGWVTEGIHRDASELIEKGKVCEGLRYALRQADIV